MRNKQKKGLSIARLGVLAAMAIVLGVAESFLSPLIPVAGVKLGVSNIIVMFAYFCYGAIGGFGVVVAKSLFAFMSRGFVAFLLSLSGGAVALSVIALMGLVRRGEFSLLLRSALGGVSHNLTQLVVIRALYAIDVLAYYAPMLVISGIVTGVATAYLYGLLKPRLEKIV